MLDFFLSDQRVVHFYLLSSKGNKVYPALVVLGKSVKFTELNAAVFAI